MDSLVHHEFSLLEIRRLEPGQPARADILTKTAAEWCKSVLNAVAASAVVCATAASSVFAQAEDADAVETADMVVTATKLEERLVDVPIAVTAVGAEQTYVRDYEAAGRFFGLVELSREMGGNDEAEAMLASAYARFSEGFWTGDLQRARALLDHA